MFLSRDLFWYWTTAESKGSLHLPGEANNSTPHPSTHINTIKTQKIVKTKNKKKHRQLWKEVMLMSADAIHHFMDELEKVAASFPSLPGVLAVFLFFFLDCIPPFLSLPSSHQGLCMHYRTHTHKRAVFHALF